MSPDSPEAEPEYNLTPRTEAKYSKIDEEFQMMMQRNQLNGSRVGVGVAGSNYNLPVSVPVGNYDQTLLQASPQMHTSISPRPSSSETDSGIDFDFSTLFFATLESLIDFAIINMSVDTFFISLL